MRSYYIRSSERKRNGGRLNPVYNELNFLRPYLSSGKTPGPGDGKQIEVALQETHTLVNTRSYLSPANKLTNFTISFQHTSGHRINISSVTAVEESSEIESESTAACYEITIEDDDACASDGLPGISGNHATVDSPDDEGDKMFGMLIVGELRKMTPAAQKMFKRNVTKLLYT